MSYLDVNLLTVFWFLFEWKREKKSFHKIYLCDKQNKVLEQQIADSQSTLCVTSATPSHETYNFNNLLILFPTKQEIQKEKLHTNCWILLYFSLFYSPPPSSAWIQANIHFDHGPSIVIYYIKFKLRFPARFLIYLLFTVYLYNKAIFICTYIGREPSYTFTLIFNRKIIWR